MKDIKAVIGANFGDEGKGLMTDFLAASGKNGIVVRFNGGAQAGHTVETPDGRRHVFGHVGSGSFCGLPSYLSAFFVVNPMLFTREILALGQHGIAPEIYIDGQCMVTTPYDMMINQIAEISRGSSKHGSCGVGFNETITRCLSSESYSLLVSDLMSEGRVREKLDLIIKEYIPRRLAQLEVNSIPERYEDLLHNGVLIDSYLQNVHNMLEEVRVTDLGILSSYKTILFEGAQGLLLDQSHGYFPHVTRSNTGMKNVACLINQAGYSNVIIVVVYVTRAYLTRHGAGPFPTELPGKPFPLIEDRTNVPNPFQDALRYGLLDIDALTGTIKRDLKNAEAINCSPKLAITCLDQLEEEMEYIVGARVERASPDSFVRRTLESLDFKSVYLSYGPSRNTIYCI